MIISYQKKDMDPLSGQQTRKGSRRPKNNFKTTVANKKTIDEKLDLIIDKIIVIDEKLTKVSDKLDTFESQFKSYVNRESYIQEATVTEYAYQTLRKNFRFVDISKHSLRYFFLPTSSDQFTDIDGCILYTPNTSKIENNISSKSHALIIEAKHLITKALVHYKIFQFCKIKQTLHDIKTNATFEKQSLAFENMVLTHNLQSFPESMFFFFASDTLSHEIKEYIYKISTMTLTEKEYNSTVFDFTKEEFNKVVDILDYRIRNDLFRLEKTVKAYSDFFKRLPMSSYKENDRNRIYSYMEQLIPFSTAQEYFAQLENTLGVIQFGILYQFQKGKDMNNTSLFGYEINQGANAWNFAKV